MRAVVQAEADYRKIWADWLQTKLDLLNLDDDAEIPERLLETAPVVSLDGKIDLAITLRVASTRTRGGEVGLQLASFPMTGSFSFAEQRSEESVFKASASFTLSNTQSDLSSYLAQHNIKPTTVAELETAANQLRQDGTAAPASTD